VIIENSIKFSNAEIAAILRERNEAERFPPIFTLGQVVELLQIPQETIGAWRSRERLNGCCCKVDDHLRLNRNHPIQIVFDEELRSRVSFHISPIIACQLTSRLVVLLDMGVNDE